MSKSRSFTVTAEYILAQDVLTGARQIAAFLGKTERWVYNKKATSKLPFVTLGNQITARKSILLAYYEAQEAKCREWRDLQAHRQSPDNCQARNDPPSTSVKD